MLHPSYPSNKGIVPIFFTRDEKYAKYCRDYIDSEYSESLKKASYEVMYDVSFHYRYMEPNDHSKNFQGYQVYLQSNDLTLTTFTKPYPRKLIKVIYTVIRTLEYMDDIKSDDVHVRGMSGCSETL